jgi:hypothetical protein
MTNQFGGDRSRRRYERVTGPFDGVLEGRVLVYDLNLGGCFVNTSQVLPEGTVSVLKINLPREGWVTVNAETLHCLQHGFGARFLDLDSDTEARIRRTVDAFKR